GVACHVTLRLGVIRAMEDDTTLSPPHCGISVPSMSAWGHSRLRRLKPHVGLCPLWPESGQVGRHVAKSALCHVWTAPSWQVPFLHVCRLVGAAMCSAC